MATIPDKELRDNVAEVLRRAEAGEEFTITVSGTPVARLGPAAKRRWVSTSGLGEVFRTPAPERLAEDLERLPAELEPPRA
jgi:prevent-host-death family protein